MRPLFAVLSLLVASTAFAEVESPPPVALPDMLTMEDALKLFRQRGYDLLIADAAVYGAEGDVHVAGAVPNPSWSLDGNYSFAYGHRNQNICSTANGAMAGANCSPWGVTATLSDSNALEDTLSGKRYLRLKVARAAVAATRLARTDAQRTLEFQVKQQYIQAVQARDSLDFALEVLKSSTQTFELIKLRYEKGAISEADEAKTETAKLEADQAVDVATQALRGAKVGLAFLLGVRGPVPDFKVEPDLPKYVVPPRLSGATPQSLLDEAIRTRPDLRALAAQRERAQAQLALAKRLRFPDLSLNLGYSQQTGSDALAAQPPTLSFGVGGTLPIFYLQRGEIQRAEAETRTQALQLSKQEAQVASDVESAFNDFAGTRRRVERMQTRLLERANRARELVAIQYQKGAASLIELLDAQRQYIATNLEYLQDLANYWTAVFQLEQAVGTDLR
jgi:cobalt-zinc-cadmium efflux system outer membrane protein